MVTHTRHSDEKSCCSARWYGCHSVGLRGAGRRPRPIENESTRSRPQLRRLVHLPSLTWRFQYVIPRMNRRTFFMSTAFTAAATSLPIARAAAPAAANMETDPAASAWGTDELRKLGIWDIHAHVGTPGSSPAKRMEALLKIADRMGVERLCICMSPPWQYEPKPEQF